jgi:predicted transcriptional regulator
MFEKTKQFLDDIELDDEIRELEAQVLNDLEKNLVNSEEEAKEFFEVLMSVSRRIKYFYNLKK